MSGTISIVIPTFYSEKLKDTLRAIESQTFFDHICEVLVVGQDRLQDIPKLSNLVYIPVSDNPTPANNRNIGVRLARGEWICFTDSDCLPAPDWIESYCKATQSGNDAFAGAVNIPKQMGYWGKCDHYLGFESQACGAISEKNLPYGATLNFCIRKNIFLSLGGFDLSYTSAGGEDREFCWRLTRAGYSITYVPSSVVVHNHDRDGYSSARKHMYHYGEVTGQFRMQHRDHWNLKQKVLFSLARIFLLGELLIAIRILSRAVLRLSRCPVLLHHPQYLPGIMILDYAHSLGMIRKIRVDYGR